MQKQKNSSKIKEKYKGKIILKPYNANKFFGQRKKLIISRLLLIAIIVELKSLLTIY
jgi:hypothetical protein